jgi:hypothetical protein
MNRFSTTTRREPVPRMPSVFQLSMISYWSRRIATHRVSTGSSLGVGTITAPPMKWVATSQPEL